MMATDAVPDRRRWSAASVVDLASIASVRTPLLRAGEPVTFVGGKLVAALAPALAAAGFPMVVSDRVHPLLADLPGEDPQYEALGHGHGEIHTAREFRQLVDRAARTFEPQEDRWREDGRVVDAFRPDLRYFAVNDREFEIQKDRHLNAVRTALRRAGTLVVALSGSEVWESSADGAAFPAWHAHGGSRFDPERHAVRGLTVEETVLDLRAAVATARELSPGLKIVVMVSPEPQLATAYPGHVLMSDSVGKAVLRIAIEMIVGELDGVSYFPALEIARWSAPQSAYLPDGSIPDDVLNAIAEALLAVSEGGAATSEEPAAAIPVLSTVPADPRPARRPRVTAPSEDVADAAEPTRKTNAKPEPQDRAARPKPVAITVVDAYSTARAAEELQRAAKREEKRARAAQVAEALGDATPVAAPTPDEREIRRQEKLAAREARTAAEAAMTPEQIEASAAARRKREEARAATLATLSAPEPAPVPDPPAPTAAELEDLEAAAAAKAAKRASRKAKKASKAQAEHENASAADLADPGGATKG